MNEPQEPKTDVPLIPTKYTPYVLAAIAICQTLAAAFALPGEWTPDRYFLVISVVLSVLVGGSLAGLHKRE